MSDFVSRREVLKRIGKATAGIALTGGVIRGQGTDIVVAGKPVEIAVASVSPTTVRISVLPIEGGRPTAIPDTLTVVSEGQGSAAGRGRTAASINSVKAGNLVVRYAANPPTLHIDTSAGQPVQKLTLDSVGPGMTFLLPKGPVLGMGEGGPQFDRKGQTFANRSGQGGYQLATHGGRVPIQWLIGTDGWALFIHRPLGAFDLTGTEGKLQPTNESLPLDVFVVSSKDPTVLMKEYARITGHPEMTALWTLGYQQSHRTLSGFETVKMVAEKFREKKLPCDAPHLSGYRLYALRLECAAIDHRLLHSE